MPPTVRTFKEGVPVNQAGAFYVEIDGPSPFNPAEFDSFANSLRIDPNQRLFYLKWIVRGSRIIFFGEKTSHAAMNYSFETRGDNGPLFSAGYLEVSQGSDGAVRRMYGDSVTLDRILPMEKSSKFKEEVLKPALEPDFEVF